MNNLNISVRKWLVENNYEDISKLIDEVMLDWKINEKQTRRNWWDILAGGKGGKPHIINGRVFPVLKAAQIRQGRLITQNAICKNEKEEIPFINYRGRWSKGNIK